MTAAKPQSVIEAAWFYSGEGDPVPNVAIGIENGIIAEIHQLTKTKSNLVIIPPIVNAHTHLELSDVREPFPPGSNFPEWIRKVIAHRRERDGHSEAVRLGLKEAAMAQTRVIADTVPVEQFLSEPTPEVSVHGSHTAGIEVIPFVEFIGLDDERVELAKRQLESLTVHASLSPHAPYSVHPDLLDCLVRHARENAMPVMMHLGETREELQLLETGTGPFADMLKAFGVWQPGLFPGRSVCEYLECLSAAPRTLIAHGNYFGDQEIDYLAGQPRTSVVYCPRTHRHFGHSEHPWRRMLDKGIKVILGTDLSLIHI